MFTCTLIRSLRCKLTLAVPYDARWLDIVGLIFFFLNLGLFVMNCVLIGLRFHYRPGSFINTFTDQVESLFIPAVVS
jgi:tellurite resistance protein TehA-like permease